MQTVVDLVEGILNANRVENVRYLPWNHTAAKALESAGFKTRTVMQIWKEHCPDHRDFEGL